jgi:hypothetical protein
MTDIEKDLKIRIPEVLQQVAGLLRSLNSIRRRLL